eukprot:TRINITY_DN1393_c0_g1_i1.p1 TRINITY_DN1393_c0_g1~~TRINITY_DN1393_c0_g1_i1.p1  ORF type:complete len:870 (+),score=250.70 TRINITY_DN1393_c0_g1_i1:147-2612(+)
MLCEAGREAGIAGALLVGAAVVAEMRRRILAAPEMREKVRCWFVTLSRDPSTSGRRNSTLLTRAVYLRLLTLILGYLRPTTSLVEVRRQLSAVQSGFGIHSALSCSEFESKLADFFETRVEFTSVDELLSLADLITDVAVDCFSEYSSFFARNTWFFSFGGAAPDLSLAEWLMQRHAAEEDPPPDEPRKSDARMSRDSGVQTASRGSDSSSSSSSEARLEQPQRQRRKDSRGGAERRRSSVRRRSSGTGARRRSRQTRKGPPAPVAAEAASTPPQPPQHSPHSPSGAAVSASPRAAVVAGSPHAAQLAASPRAAQSAAASPQQRGRGHDRERWKGFGKDKMASRAGMASGGEWVSPTSAESSVVRGVQGRGMAFGSPTSPAAGTPPISPTREKAGTPATSPTRERAATPVTAPSRDRKPPSPSPRHRQADSGRAARAAGSPKRKRGQRSQRGGSTPVCETPGSEGGSGGGDVAGEGDEAAGEGGDGDEERAAPVSPSLDPVPVLSAEALRRIDEEASGGPVDLPSPFTPATASSPQPSPPAPRVRSPPLSARSFRLPEPAAEGPSWAMWDGSDSSASLAASGPWEAEGAEELWRRSVLLRRLRTQPAGDVLRGNVRARREPRTPPYARALCIGSMLEAAVREPVSPRCQRSGCGAVCARVGVAVASYCPPNRWLPALQTSERCAMAEAAEEARLEKVRKRRAPARRLRPPRRDRPPPADPQPPPPQPCLPPPSPARTGTAVRRTLRRSSFQRPPIHRTGFRPQRAAAAPMPQPRSRPAPRASPREPKRRPVQLPFVPTLAALREPLEQPRSRGCNLECLAA